MKKFFLSSILFLLAISFANDVCAQSKSISGTAYYTTAFGTTGTMAGVTIYLYDGDNNLLGSTTTGSNGSYSLPIPNGTDPTTLKITGQKYFSSMGGYYLVGETYVSYSFPHSISGADINLVRVN